LGAVDGRARDEHVRARLGAALDRLVRHPAVDLDPDLAALLAGGFGPQPGVPGGEHGAGAADLRQHHVEELLAAEAGLHRHQQHHVDLVEQVLEGLDGGPRVEGEPGPGTRRADGTQRAHRCLGRLRVDGDAARARLGVGGGVPVRVIDHEVAVDRQRGVFEQRLDDRQAEGEVRDEVVVHHVDVKPVGGFLDGLRLVREPREVGRQDAGRDLNGHAVSSRRGDPP
jgi:hypothetical protein